MQGQLEEAGGGGPGAGAARRAQGARQGTHSCHEGTGLQGGGLGGGLGGAWGTREALLRPVSSSHILRHLQAGRPLDELFPRLAADLSAYGRVLTCEILPALKKLGEKIEPKEEAFLAQHMTASMADFEAVKDGGGTVGEAALKGVTK